MLVSRESAQSVAQPSKPKSNQYTVAKMVVQQGQPETKLIDFEDMFTNYAYEKTLSIHENLVCMLE